MKTNKLITLALLASIALLFSCKSKTSETAATTENPAATETATPKGKYAIKSGIVEYKTQMMGMDMKQILSFDDYGKKEVTEMITDMMGVKIHTVTLIKDGFVYNYDLEKKTGTKSVSYQSSSNIDFENLSEQMVKDMNLKKEGTEDYLGKSCEKMSIDYTKMKLKGTYLVYKGIALKMDADMGTMKMNLIGEKFIENPEIPAAKFEVPADIKITENK
jgi:hypothetical protein